MIRFLVVAWAGRVGGAVLVVVWADRVGGGWFSKVKIMKDKV